MNRTLLTLFIGLLAATAAHAEPRDFPRPAQLEPDVAFWKRIYAEVGTDGGLIHDMRDLRVVYEVVKLPHGIQGKARQRHTDGIKKKYKAILKTLSGGKRSGLTREEKRVLALFGPNVSNKTLLASASQLRFQLGQADKFRAGVIRSGAFKPYILDNLRRMDLPLEIANLPHVESSYTTSVYSRVGAAGLWQFTRSTGRRFMQIDHIVDERLDGYRASIAAARLLEQNHRLTGSWPLAITAYNHGAAGMRRAAKKLGTTDIVQVVRKYKSRSFGFASRNFYVEFLAADEVASNAERYFGPLVLDQPIAFETIELPFYAKPQELARAIGVNAETFKEANPSLRTAVWNGSKYIPKGYEIRIPLADLPRPLSQSIASLPKSQRYARQTRDASYTVRRGDTVSTIARRHGVKTSQLVSLNGLKSKHRIRIGQKLRLPGDGAPNDSVAHVAREKSVPKRAPSTPTTTASTTTRQTDPPAQLPDGGIYRVRRGDNLTEIADRFEISVAQLVSLNGLRSRHRIAIGQELRVSPAIPSAGSKTPASKPPAAKTNSEVAVALSPAPTAKSNTAPGDLMESTAALALASASPSPNHPADEPGDQSDESEIEPSTGILADPSDYTVATDETILVQPNETLGHYAEWLGLRASQLRKINRLKYGEAVGIQQKLRLDFSTISPDAFERIRVEFHRSLQEDFFAQWEIEGTLSHRVGAGDSLWTLSRQRFEVPIWLLRQYNPDVDLEALSRGTMLTIPRLRERRSDAKVHGTIARAASAG